jgi:hypothetical protein
VVAAMSLPLLAAASETVWELPRTVDGRPDLQGVWVNDTATPLQRPRALAGRETLTDDEVARLEDVAGRLFASGSGDAAHGEAVFQAALRGAEDFTSEEGATGDYNQFWLAERRFDNRTSLVVDPPNGLVPAVTPQARERFLTIREARLRAPSGPEDRRPIERCISAGVPNFEAGNNSYTQIFQTVDHVAILMEVIHDVRIVPMDDRPYLGAGIRQWHGDPRGRWEGDTLVVETVNFSPKGGFVGASENLHLIERFTRVGPERLRYEVTLDDPTTWVRPWTAMILLRKTDEPIFEYACHEGNYGMTGMLAGARADERAAGSSADSHR